MLYFFKLEKVDELIKDAVSKGGKIVCGGKRKGEEGLFYEPTVVCDINSTMRLATEEVGFCYFININ